MRKFKLWYYDKQGKMIEVVVWADEFETAFEKFHKTYGDDVEVNFIREINKFLED